MQQGQAGGEAVVGDAVDADAAVVVRDVLDQPVDGVVGVGGLVGRLGVGQVDLRRQLEDAFRLEAAAQILDRRRCSRPPAVP